MEYINNRELHKINSNLEQIKELLISLHNNVEVQSQRITSLESSVKNLNKKVDDEIMEECKKMGSHIDFVENVYDNVKHPLGYICKKIQYLTGSSDEQYTLTDLVDTTEDNSDFEDEENEERENE